MTNFEQNDFNPQLRPSVEVDPFATRWVFFAGDVIAADRKIERKDLAHGGEEVIAVTMARTRGFLPRGRLTPMEKWFDSRVQEEFAPGVKTGGTPLHQVHARMTDLPMIEASKTAEAQGMVSQRSPLVAVWKPPASEILQVINSSYKEKRIGVVEIEPLRGMEYEAVKNSGLQQIFLPTFPNLPPTLRELEALLRNPAQMNDDVRKVQGHLLQSVEEFRLFANVYLEAAHALVRKAVNPQGFTHIYDPVAETLMIQMEAERVDQHLNKQAAQQADLGRTLDKLVEIQADLARGRVDTSKDEVIAEMKRQLLEQSEKINQLLAANNKNPQGQQPRRN